MVDTNGPEQCTNDADLLVKKRCRNFVKREEEKLAQRQLDMMDYKFGQTVLWIWKHKPLKLIKMWNQM